ncbi:MAG TPA: MOSC domain-containing protein, partial [Nitrospiraceae bacterium]|nr:MOSC domain-containing protein [Nitrospiraceae bacterium]
DRLWKSAIYKKPVAGPIWMGRYNLAGDGQADLQHHGGPDKAVNVYPGEHYARWRTALDAPTMEFGAFGENFTTQNLLETEICIGDLFALGAAMVQVSQPRQPCWKLARRWRRKDLPVLVEASGFTGWYFRVLEEGFVESDMPLRLLERPYPDWTVMRANHIMQGSVGDVEIVRKFAACPALSTSWEATLERRLSTGAVRSARPRILGSEAGI